MAFRFCSTLAAPCSAVPSFSRSCSSRSPSTLFPFAPSLLFSFLFQCNSSFSSSFFCCLASSLRRGIFHNGLLKPFPFAASSFLLGTLRLHFYQPSLFDPERFGVAILAITQNQQMCLLPLLCRLPDCRIRDRRRCDISRVSRSQLIGRLSSGFIPRFVHLFLLISCDPLFP